MKTKKSCDIKECFLQIETGIVPNSRKGINYSTWAKLPSYRYIKANTNLKYLKYAQLPIASSTSQSLSNIGSD